MNINKRMQNWSFPSLVIVALMGVIIFAFANSAEPQPVREATLVGLDSQTFHSVYNVTKINESFTRKYLDAFANFTRLEYKQLLVGKSSESIQLKVGSQYFARPEGYLIDGKRLVIDLIVCDEETNHCAFRINGVPTKGIFNENNPTKNRTNVFQINKNLVMRIDNIQFNYCGGKRFCDLYFDTVDLVDISIINE